jgi:hypothetical protein
MFKFSAMFYSCSVLSLSNFNAVASASENVLKNECRFQNDKKALAQPDVGVSFSELNNGYSISFYSNDQSREQDLKNEIQLLVDEKRARTPRLGDGYGLEEAFPSQDPPSKFCILGPASKEVMSLVDVDFAVSPNSSGYDLIVTSENSYRKSSIRNMVFELLVEKSLATHSVSDGYGLLSH